MSKVANAIKMLILLKSRGKMKISEIARELEVGEREVRRYRDDLEQAKIYITSIQGVNGGYVYEEKGYLLGLNLIDEEYSALLMALEQLKHDNFISYKEFESLVDKINCLKEYPNHQSLNTEYFIKNTKSNYDYEKERKIWIDINAAIITGNKMKIKYQSLSSGEKERIIRPYAVFQYRGSMYFVGYCEYRNSIRDFKVSRIKEYKILQEKFDKDKNFNLKNYMNNCFGIFKDKEYNIKLKIKYPMAQVVKEKVWVENQEIIENMKDNSITFQATMKGMIEIKSWILSMGSSVEVLEPTDLKQEIKNEIKKMWGFYEKF